MQKAGDGVFNLYELSNHGLYYNQTCGAERCELAEQIPDLISWMNVISQYLGVPLLQRKRSQQLRFKTFPLDMSL